MVRHFVVTVITVMAVVLFVLSSAHAAPSAYLLTGSNQWGTINLTTGAFSQLGNTGVLFGGIASYGGKVYGETPGESLSTLYQINVSNGAVAIIGTGTVGCDGFGSTASGLYVFDADSTGLYSINPGTGAATLRGLTGITPEGGVYGMSAGAGGLYLAWDHGTGSLLYLLNTNTGAATLIGNTGVSGIGALGWVNGVLYAGTYDSPYTVWILNTTSGLGTFVTNTSGGISGAYSLSGAPQNHDGKDGNSGSSSSHAIQSLESARDTPIGNQSQENSKQNKTDNKEDVIYFGGAATRPELGPVKLASLADHYIPLESMDANVRIQAFYFWLGKVYVNLTPPREPNEGTRAEDDPFLVLQFSKDYEAGGWRKLGVGVTLEEMALMTELSNGHRFMTLINSAGPQQPTSRIKRKLFLSADVILELLTVNYHLKANRRRHPSPVLYYDKQGHTGHAISLFDADLSGTRFAYSDPWPGRSLLCEENNKAGVKAQSLGKHKLHFPERDVDIEDWEVSRSELAGILVATLLDVDDFWAVLLATAVDKQFSQLRDELRRAMAAQAEEGLR